MSDDNTQKNFCGSCGKELKPNAKFCSECGTPLGDAPASGTPPSGDTVSRTPPGKVEINEESARYLEYVFRMVVNIIMKEHSNFDIAKAENAMRSFVLNHTATITILSAKIKQGRLWSN